MSMMKNAKIDLKAAVIDLQEIAGHTVVVSKKRMPTLAARWICRARRAQVPLNRALRDFDPEFGLCPVSHGAGAGL
jgi:hypothetical protein